MQKQVVNNVSNLHCPVAEIPTRSKLSCISWNKQNKPLIASSDYEGIVTVWDVNRSQVTPFNRGYLHDERRIYLKFRIFLHCSLHWQSLPPIQSVMEYEEHEKRAWSVDFSRSDPKMLVSGSDDGKVCHLVHLAISSIALPNVAGDWDFGCIVCKEHLSCGWEVERFAGKGLVH